MRVIVCSIVRSIICGIYCGDFIVRIIMQIAQLWLCASLCGIYRINLSWLCTPLYALLCTLLYARFIMKILLYRLLCRLCSFNCALPYTDSIVQINCVIVWVSLCKFHYANCILQIPLCEFYHANFIMQIHCANSIVWILLCELQILLSIHWHRPCLSDRKAISSVL